VQSSVRKTSDRVITGIKNALDEKGIDMPFPHMVLMTQEGPLQIESEAESQKSKAAD
jgi:small-conductance mechanosensitive channel